MPYHCCKVGSGCLQFLKLILIGQSAVWSVERSKQIYVTLFKFKTKHVQVLDLAFTSGWFWKRNGTKLMMPSRT